MICCEACEIWFHGACVGVEEDDVDDKTTWVCSQKCKDDLPRNFRSEALVGNAFKTQQEAGTACAANLQPAEALLGEGSGDDEARALATTQTTSADALNNPCHKRALLSVAMQDLRCIESGLRDQQGNLWLTATGNPDLNVFAHDQDMIAKVLNWQLPIVVNAFFIITRGVPRRFVLVDAKPLDALGIAHVHNTQQLHAAQDCTDFSLLKGARPGTGLCGAIPGVTRGSYAKLGNSSIRATEKSQSNSKGGGNEGIEAGGSKRARGAESDASRAGTDIHPCTSPRNQVSHNQRLVLARSLPDTDIEWSPRSIAMTDRASLPRPSCLPCSSLEP